MGGAEGKAAYIDTEGTFRPEVGDLSNVRGYPPYITDDLVCSVAELLLNDSAWM